MTRPAAPTLCFLLALGTAAPAARAAEGDAGIARVLGGAGARVVATLLETRPTFSAAGVGLYPIRVGFEVPSLSLASYVAVGGNASLIRTRPGAELAADTQVVGAVAEPRLSVGARLRPARSFALSAEVGYAPWAVGLVVRPSAAPAAASAVVDLSFGVEWQ